MREEKVSKTYKKRGELGIELRGHILADIVQDILRHHARSRAWKPCRWIGVRNAEIRILRNGNDKSILGSKNARPNRTCGQRY